jgi:hypothetical protein
LENGLGCEPSDWAGEIAGDHSWSHGEPAAVGRIAAGSLRPRSETKWVIRPELNPLIFGVVNGRIMGISLSG